MAITVGTPSTRITQSSTSAIASRPLGVVQGTVLVAVLSSALVGVTVTAAPSGWTLLQDSSSDLVSYYKVAGAAEPNSYTWSMSATTTHRVIVTGFDGVSTTAPINASAKQATETAPSVGTTLPSCLVVRIFSSHDLSVPQTIAGQAAITDTSTPDSIAHNLIVRSEQPAAGSTGTVTAAYTAATNPRWAQTVALRPVNSAPNAPTISIPANVDRTRSLDVNVAFSDPDLGDTASWSAIRFRRTDLTPVPAWTQVSRQSPQTVVTIPADTLTVGPYELQGASRDAQGLPVADSALVWSASVFFDGVDPPPGPVFTAPAQGATIAASSVTATFSSTTITASEWQAVDGAGVLVDSGTGGASARSFTATGLVNGSTVTLRLRVQQDGLWSAWVESTHPVSFTPPALPTVTLATAVDTEGRSFGLVVDVTNPAPGTGEPSVTHHDVYVRCSASNPTADRYRPRTDTGTRVRVDLPAGGTWTDATLVKGVDYEYRVVSFGGNGTTSTSAWAGAATGEVFPDPYGGY